MRINFVARHAGLECPDRKTCVFAELGIGHHQTVIGIPENECLGNILDGFPDTHIGFCRLLRKAMLFTDVECNADEVQIIFGRDLGTNPHPDPRTIRMAHTENAIHMRNVTSRCLFRNRIKIAVFWIDDCRHVAKGKHSILRLIAEHLIHGARPVDASACHIPIPQTTTTTRKRHIDTTLDLAGKIVGFAGTRCLTEIGIENCKHHSGRACKERHVKRYGAFPFSKYRAFRFRCNDSVRNSHWF